MKIKYSALNIKTELFTTVTVNKIFNLFYKNEMPTDLNGGAARCSTAWR